MLNPETLPEVQGCYLLHIEPRYHQAGHRAGWSKNIRRRVRQHLSQAAKASPLIIAALRAGHDVQVARIWPDTTLHNEAKMRAQKNSPRYCPICQKASS